MTDSIIYIILGDLKLRFCNSLNNEQMAKYSISIRKW